MYFRHRWSKADKLLNTNFIGYVLKLYTKMAYNGSVGCYSIWSVGTEVLLLEEEACPKIGVMLATHL